ncbi:MAG: bacterial transcriptional activator domain-containing protein, partial [Acidimicrobiales bacterium]
EETTVAALLQSITTQLATGTWIDHVDILLVGTMSTADVTGAARVRRVPAVDAAIDELERIAKSFDESLDAGLHSTTLDARISGAPNDGWIPTILVCTDVIDDENVKRLATLTASGERGVGAVVRSTRRAKWHAEVDSTRLVLDPLGFVVTPSLIEAEAADAIDSFLTDVAIGDANETEAFVEPSVERKHFEAFEERPFEIEIRVLGPVEVIGTSTPIDRRKSVELATYLALHPRGVTDDRLKTILWPNDPPADGTFNTTVSQTRSKLGNANDGTAHFPRFSDAGLTYRLGRFVTTDLARFEARVRYAQGLEASAAMPVLRDALDLVRGHPFEGTRGYEWAFSEGHVASAEATVADAAHRLAELYLAVGDHAGAAWAAMQGLKASPGYEVLYRDRMLACDLAGNPAGVESAMDELCEVVETLEPYDSLHPETLALYERTSHGRRARSAR